MTGQGHVVLLALLAACSGSSSAPPPPPPVSEPVLEGEWVGIWSEYNAISSGIVALDIRTLEMPTPPNGIITDAAVELGAAFSCLATPRSLTGTLQNGGVLVFLESDRGPLGLDPHILLEAVLDPSGNAMGGRYEVLDAGVCLNAGLWSVTRN